MLKSSLVGLLRRSSTFVFESCLLRWKPVHMINTYNRYLFNSPCSLAKTIDVKFQLPDGSLKTVSAKEGSSILDVVIDNDLSDGFGACEGTIACSTCHVILEQSLYDDLDPPCDEEMDMLDLAFDLTDTSRLGCQIEVKDNLKDSVIQLPPNTIDARV